jgi:hypothetical protein
MKLLALGLLAALGWYRLPDGSYTQLDDATSLPAKLHAVKAEGRWEAVEVAVTNTVPRNEQEYAWWYWVKVTCGQTYGYPTNATMPQIQAALIRAQQAAPTNALIATDALVALVQWQSFGSKVPWNEPTATVTVTTSNLWRRVE